MNAGMVITAKSAGRYGFKCFCCQPAPGKGRKVQRRTLKRRERQEYARQIRQEA